MWRGGPVGVGILEGIGFGFCVEYLPLFDRGDPPELRGAITRAVLWTAFSIGMNLWNQENKGDEWISHRPVQLIWLAGAIAALCGIGAFVQWRGGEVHTFYWLTAVLWPLLTAAAVRLAARAQPGDLPYPERRE